LADAPRFDGKVAIVTGGSNGLGRAITDAFTAAGARVLICDLAESGYFAGREDVATVLADIADPGTASAVLAAAVSRWGRADILVNDAAAYPNATLLETEPADWERVFAVNVTGTFLMTQAFARHCVARGAADAAIVSISTGSARSPRPAGAAYAASKAAVETMSKVFAMELGPHGIRVNVVAPGYIDVRGWSEAFPDRATDEMRARLVASIPLGRSGRPADIASAVLFLASAAAGHITGTVLAVDGGSNAGRLTLAPGPQERHASVRG
jgi:NAD(P)-dependent dehydrogenase (short-subunit alcohol dehydrogenase family)